MSFPDLFFQAREDWRDKGPPNEAWAGAGPGWLMARKGIREDITGLGGGGAGALGESQLALFSQLGGRGGANYDYSFRFGTSATGERFRVPPGQTHEILRLTQKEIEYYQGDGLVAGIPALNSKMATTAARSNCSNSSLFWSNSTGLIAKGDGAYDVTLKVITFKNRLDAEKWEIGDRLIFASVATVDATAAGVMPVTRAFADANPANVNGFLQVAKVNRRLGKVECNVNVDDAIPTAVNTDWIGAASYFGGEDPIIGGVFTWLAPNETIANKTLYSVDRSKDPDRLAGRRVKLDGSESPWDICGKIGEQATLMVGAPLEGDSWCIYVGAGQIQPLMDEMRAQEIKFTSSSSSTDPIWLRMGVQHVSTVIPGLGEVKIIADKYLTDSTLTADEDKTYILLNESNIYIGTSPSGYGWKVYDKQPGVTHQQTGTQNIHGQFSLFGNFYNTNAGRGIYAGPNTDL